jgi:hypothetical protein
MPVHVETTFNVVRIIGDLPSPRTPYAMMRDTIGTGFVLTAPGEVNPTRRFGYLVTAAHVLEGQSNIEMRVARLDGTLAAAAPIGGWRVPVPSLDLALAPMPVPPSPDVLRYWSHTVELAVPVGALHTAVPGDSIYYIGVLTALDRTMLRAGTIGAIDQLGVGHDGGYDYPCHLVDCRSYGGFSGSPCYLVKHYPTTKASAWPLPAPYTEQGEGAPHGALDHIIVLVGMFTEHLTDSKGAETYSSRYGVGVMLRSQEIREVLMSEEMREERRQWEVDADGKEPDAPKLTNVSRAPIIEPPSTLDTTADLLGKLMEVPKDEARTEEV